MSVRYLQEYAPLGTAGGLHHFRDQIRAGSPDAFVVMNGDVCAEFPLQEMLEFHASKEQAVATILGTEATRQQSVNYGCVVEDKNTHTILHYVEKPSSYISCIINCGVYVFSSQIFPMLAVGLLIEKRLLVFLGCRVCSTASREQQGREETKQFGWKKMCLVLLLAQTLLSSFRLSLWAILRIFMGNPSYSYSEVQFN